jgi:hypothetical protein
MAKRYLLLILLLVQHLAQAQVYELATAGILLGSAALKGKPQDANEFVTTLAYKGKPVQQKRTPSEKIKGKAAAEIAHVEAALAACSKMLLADNLTATCTDQQYFDLQSALQRINALQPRWSTAAYAAENEFYRSENYFRQQQRDQLARLRRQHEQDSVQRIHLAKARRTDSLLMVAYRKQQTEQDSLQRAAQRAADLASPYRYVNAASLVMRTAPAPTAKQWATVGKGSTVMLLSAGKEWSKVQVSERQGYVLSRYLVASAADVSPEFRDQEMMRLTGPQYTNVAWEEDAPATVRSRTAPTHAAHRAAVATRATASKRNAVYVCGGGSAYAFHSSSSCSGLNRCSSGVSAVSLADAQSMGRTPCKKCH